MNKNEIFLRDMFEAIQSLEEEKDRKSFEEAMKGQSPDETKEIYKFSDYMLRKGWILLKKDDIDKAVYSYQGPMEKWPEHIVNKLKDLI